MSKNISKIISENIENKSNSIDLSNCNLTDFPIDILQNKNLEDINISNNFLYELPIELFKLPNLNNINLKGNPLVKPPIELADDDDNIEKIRNYFDDLNKFGEDYLHEVKLIILGDERAGKTTLMRTLCNGGFKFELGKELSTPGIDIRNWELTSEERKIKINIWDFGGQEVYHSTHQFFLTKNTIYIYLTEARRDTRIEDVYYWLNFIKLLGKGSPVIIVQNKCDEPHIDLPINEYKEIFGNIVGYEKISCVPDNLYFKNIKSLVETLLKNIENKSVLPRIFTPLPKFWISIRQELENLKAKGEYYLDFKDYLKLCKSKGISELNAKYIINFYNELGIVIYYEDWDLNNTIFLNPDWVLNAIYKIFDCQEIINSSGLYNKSLLDILWKGKSYLEKKNEFIYLIHKREYEISLRIDENQFLVPKFLKTDEPENLNWNFENNYRYEFQYPNSYMPKGIFFRLLAKLYKYLFENIKWKHGCIIQNFETKALIIDSFINKRITVYIAGNEIFKLLEFIKIYLNEINFELNVTAIENILCCCPQCIDNETATRHNTETIFKYKNRNYKKIDCVKDEIEQVPIDKLIYGFNENTKIEVILDQLLSEIISISLDIQGMYKTTAKDENGINDLFYLLLKRSGYLVEAQKRYGEADTEVAGIGNLDLAISAKNGVILSIFEAFNLTSFSTSGKEYAKAHVLKLSRKYDPNKLKQHFLVVYSKKENFNNTWNEYKDFMTKLKFDYPLKENTGFNDISDKYCSNSSNIKLGLTEHLREENDILKIYHIFMNMKF